MSTPAGLTGWRGRQLQAPDSDTPVRRSWLPRAHGLIRSRVVPGSCACFVSARRQAQDFRIQVSGEHPAARMIVCCPVFSPLNFDSLDRLHPRPLVSPIQWTKERHTLILPSPVLFGFYAVHPQLESAMLRKPYECDRYDHRDLRVDSVA